MIKKNLLQSMTDCFLPELIGLSVSIESYWPQVYLSHRLISCLPVDHFRDGLLHILPGGGSIVWHTWHRGHRLHNRQRYTKGAPLNSTTTPAILSMSKSSGNWQWFKVVQLMPHFLWIIIIIFRFHLNSNLRCSRKGPNHPGLCERERENGEDHCADGRVWCRASEPRTGVWREDSESEGLWGEKTFFI